MQEEPQRNQFSPQVYFLFCVTSGPIYPCRFSIHLTRWISEQQEIPINQ